MNASPIRLTRVAFSSLVPLALALGGCANVVTDADGAIGSDPEALTSSICPDDVPAALTPAPDQRLWFALQGDGVQIYDCKATTSGYAWTFRAPEANLLDDGGEVVGHHYAGPTWEYEDGSTVVAAKKAAATVDPTAIPWLLLTAVSHGGPDGKLTQVTTIQRLSTTGGLAPATGCDADHIGGVARVPYTAQYVFYKTASGSSDNPQCGG